MKKILIALSFLAICSCNNFSSDNTTEKENTWITIFDGENSNALRGFKLDSFPEGVWNVNDGILSTNPDTANVDLITKERFKDFELEYEWAVDTAANSGVFFHVQEKMEMESGNGNSPNWLENFEIQVLDDLHFYDTVAVRSAGSLYDLIAPTNKTLKTIGSFNKAVIKSVDGHVEHWLNGSKVLDFQVGSTELNKLISNSKFSENSNFATDTEGHIMFQHHGQKVYYRNIRVKRID